MSKCGNQTTDPNVFNGKHKKLFERIKNFYKSEFNLKEHNDILLELHGDQMFDGSSRGQIHNEVCPKCGSFTIYHCSDGHNAYQYVECQSCKWIGHKDTHIPTFEEYTNENRFDKLKDILNG